MKAALIAIAFGLVLPAFGQEAPPAFTPEVETTAREIGKSLRCVVCQNQSIEESGAPLAADMRRLVRERLASGQGKDEVVAYMVDRYGNFVLMKPPFQADTLLLWLGPVALLLLALWAWLAFLLPGRRRSFAPEPLSEAETVQLREHMGPGGNP
jgi:cytochrome c-type biogenesis protein CcmH